MPHLRLESRSLSVHVPQLLLPINVVDGAVILKLHVHDLASVVADVSVLGPLASFFAVFPECIGGSAVSR